MENNKKYQASFIRSAMSRIIKEAKIDVSEDELEAVLNKGANQLIFLDILDGFKKSEDHASDVELIKMIKTIVSRDFDFSIPVMGIKDVELKVSKEMIERTRESIHLSFPKYKYVTFKDSEIAEMLFSNNFLLISSIMEDELDTEFREIIYYKIVNLVSRKIEKTKIELNI